MPKSKSRKGTNRSSKRNKNARQNRTAARRARTTQAAQEEAARVRGLRRSRWRPALGWSLIGAGVLVLVSHLIQHAGFLNLLPGPAADLLMGYPTAFGLAVVGVVVLTR